MNRAIKKHLATTGLNAKQVWLEMDEVGSSMHSLAGKELLSNQISEN